MIEFPPTPAVASVIISKYTVPVSATVIVESPSKSTVSLRIVPVPSFAVANLIE